MTVINKVRHYKINPDGSLRFVGIERVEAEEFHWNHLESLDWRDEADARRRSRDAEAFEALVDAACGE